MLQAVGGQRARRVIGLRVAIRRFLAGFGVYVFGLKGGRCKWIREERMKGRFSFHWLGRRGFLMPGFPGLVKRAWVRRDAKESERGLEEAKASSKGLLARE